MLNQFQASLIGEGVSLRTPSSVPDTNGKMPSWNTNGTFAGWVPAVSPAGVGTELQYRNGTVFGAVTGSSWDGSVITLPRLTLPAGSVSAPSLSFGGDTNSGFYTVADGTLSFASNGVTKWLASASTGLTPATHSLRLDDSMGIGWSTSPDAVADELILFRSAAGEITLGGGLEAAAKVSLVIKAASAQSANIQEWKNHSGSLRAAITSAGQVIISTATPASASAPGVAGTIAWDADYIYVCTATNTWKRVAIATW